MKEIKKFEIVGLYPRYGRKNNFMVFSGHVYFMEPLNLDVRGFKITISKDKSNRVYDPMEMAYDYEDEQISRFPIFKFCGEENKTLMQEVFKSLEEEAEKEFLKFSFTENFPKNYNEYKKFLKVKKSLPKKIRTQKPRESKNRYARKF